MGEIDTAAEMVTAGLTGRAVEPRAGEQGRDGHGGATCLNCGTALIGEHCHACGQAGHVHRTMGAIGHDIAHGVLHFDGKIWRTLPMLALRPGELTRRYIAGERARFVSPMALFLFSVFLMFAVVANLPGWDLSSGDFMAKGMAARMADARTQLSEEQTKAEADLARYSQQLAEARAEKRAEAIGRYERRVADATQARDGLITAQAALKVGDAAPKPRAATTENWFEAKYRHAKENPKLLLYKVKTSAYKFSWALIPISLPFIWLLFPLRRDVGLYDHAIFATYSLTFMSLLTILLAALGAVGVPAGWLWTAAVFIPPFHIYRQLKGAYRLSRLGALWRTFWMVNFALVTSTLFVLLLIYLGVAD